MIDEAFGRGSDESAQYGLRLFQQPKLQLLIVTTLQKIHIIEPFVANVGFVSNQHGRDSKLRNLSIEEYRAVLAEWLGLVLPAEAVDTSHSGVGQFALRYGFRDKPVRIRFRVLDPGLTLLPGVMLPDIALDADSFAALDVPIRRVFITENETNFLAFPPVAGSIVVFGAGYGWDALARAEWLTRCTVHYWGDIDTHGAAILDQLRGCFAHVESFLMDRSTLLAHEALWGEEHDQATHALSRLTPAEHALFDELRTNCIRVGLRLEQERIGFQWVKAALAEMAGGLPLALDHGMVEQDTLWNPAQ